MSCSVKHAINMKRIVDKSAIILSSAAVFCLLFASLRIYSIFLFLLLVLLSLYLFKHIELKHTDIWLKCFSGIASTLFMIFGLSKFINTWMNSELALALSGRLHIPVRSLLLIFGIILSVLGFYLIDRFIYCIFNHFLTLLKESDHEIVIKDALANNKGAIYIFIGASLLYLFLGLYMVKNIDYRLTNYFFGSDVPRVFNDMTRFYGEHYRTLVHPLFLLLIQPIVSVLSLIFHSPEYAVLLLEAMSGGLSVCFVYLILKKLLQRKIYAYIFTAVYAFCFSSLIFFVIPETYVFSAVLLCGFCLWLVQSTNNKSFELTAVNKFWIVFWGIVSISITVTNFAMYIICLVFLLKKAGLSLKAGIKKFFVFNIITGIITATLAVIQTAIWNTPVFVVTFIKFALNTLGFKQFSFEENNYIDYSITFDKLFTLIKQCILYPFYSPNIKVNNSYYKPFLCFSDYSIYTLIVLAIIVIFVLFSAVAFNKYRKQNGKKNQYIAVFGLMLLFNLCLHYFYGNNEGFIYSSHFTFIVVIIAAMLADCFEIKWQKYCVTALCCLFLLYEIHNNLIAYFQIISYTRDCNPVENISTESILNRIIITVFIGICVFVIMKIPFVAKTVSVLRLQPNTYAQIFIIIVITVALIIGTYNFICSAHPGFMPTIAAP